MARGAGTAVHYGIKFFCTEPVTYHVRIGVDDFYETHPGPGGAITRHTGGSPVVRDGVAGEPFAEAYSNPCVNNLNSGWEVWDQSSLGDTQKHNDRNKRITVGCRVV